MDFEIEGDDDYDFGNDWKKSTNKKSFFSGSGGSGPAADDEYGYDFEYHNVDNTKNKKDKNSHMRSSYAQPGTVITSDSKFKDVKNVSKSMSAIDKSGDDALMKAQNMLLKYSSKPIAKKKTASSMFDFDEDDISVDSDIEARVVKKSNVPKVIYTLQNNLLIY